MTAQAISATRRPKFAAETPLQEFEGVLYSIGRPLAYARTDLRERFPSHDAACDAAVRATEEAVRPLLRHPDPLVRESARVVLARCADYHRADRAEDGAVCAAADRVDEAHTEARVGASLIEQHETGRARGRHPRRPTVAAQPELLGVEA